MTWNEVHLVTEYPHDFPDDWNARAAWERDKGKAIRIGQMYTRAEVDAMGWKSPLGCKCELAWAIHPEDALGLYGNVTRNTLLFACRALLEMD